MSKSLRTAFALCALMLGVAAIAGLPRIPQDLGYHVFADTRSFGIIPNAHNVFSNVFFTAAGIAGLATMGRRRFPVLWRTFYWSIILVGVGSAFYHLAPANWTLVFDRIPMAMGFASLVSIMVAERMSERAGRFLLIPLLAAGVGSVVYWYAGELRGAGDLRPYMAVQFLPLLLMPLHIVLFPEKKSAIDKPLLLLVIGYCIAKFFELEDGVVYGVTRHLVSGHTLKHVTAGLAILFFRPAGEPAGLKASGTDGGFVRPAP